MKMKQEDEAASLDLIRQLMESEEEAKEEVKRQASEDNKPDCKICFGKIEFDEIQPFQCGHMFHPACKSQMVKSGVESKIFPLRCPDEDCGIELTEREIKMCCEQDMF